MKTAHIDDATVDQPVNLDGPHGADPDGPGATMYPSHLYGLCLGDKVYELDSWAFSSWYLYVHSGVIVVEYPGGQVVELLRGGYAAGSGGRLRGGTRVVSDGQGGSESNRCALFIRRGYRAQRAAGAIEPRGRLAYIDGCSDSMLVYPPRMGDPVLNHLHFPPGIVQTQHLHPSIRLGFVAYGYGEAFGPGLSKKLSPGTLFMLDEMEIHSFRTDKEGAGKPSDMGVIAYHPDSDWGPTDGGHPMLNRTYINHGKVG